MVTGSRPRSPTLEEESEAYHPHKHRNSEKSYDDSKDLKHPLYQYRYHEVY
jgi:hypothetical protein